MTQKVIFFDDAQCAKVVRTLSTSDLPTVAEAVEAQRVVITGSASGTITDGAAVTVRSGGTWEVADRADSSKRAVGIARVGANSGGVVRIQFSGTLSNGNYSGFVAGSCLFLNRFPTFNVQTSQTTVSLTFSQRLGEALGGSQINIAVSDEVFDLV